MRISEPCSRIWISSPRRWLRWSALWTAALGALATPPGQAHANGRFPSSITVTVDGRASPPRRLLALTFGSALSVDGAAGGAPPSPGPAPGTGRGWRWLCEDPLGYGGPFDPHYAVTAAGTLLSTSLSGITRSEDGGCTWSASTGGGQGSITTSVAAHPTDGARVYATTQATGANGGLHRSMDGGAHFDTVLERANATVVSVMLAPSEPSRVYAVSYAVNPRLAQLHRSMDGGDTWTTVSLDGAVGQEVPELLAVHWTQPDVLYLRVRPGSPDDRLLRSADGGGTFVELLRPASRILAFAQRHDGSLWVATDSALLVSNDGQPFTTAPGTPPKALCLFEGVDGLYACGRNYQDGYALGRTTDGQTWEPLFRFDQLAGPLECPVVTPTFSLCASKWPAIAAQFVPPAPPLDPPTAGDPMASTVRGGGCTRCDSGGSSRANVPALLLWVLAMVGWRHPRRSTAKKDI